MAYSEKQILIAFRSILSNQFLKRLTTTQLKTQMRLNIVFIFVLIGTTLCFDWRKYVPKFVDLDDEARDWDQQWHNLDGWESDATYGEKVVDSLDKSLTHYGSLVVKNGCTSNELKVYGSATIRGNLKAEEVTVTGPLSILGSSVVAKLTVTGALTATDIKTETCSVVGNVQAKSISAKAIELKIDSSSSISEINADSVLIKTKENTPKVKVNSIVGKNIVLHNVFAKSVRGENVTLFHSHVESLTYSTNLTEFHSDVESKQQI